MDKEISNIINSFEQLKQVTDRGTEFWRARDLQPLLGYSKWERLHGAIERARDACRGSGEDPDRHILATGNMVDIGSGAKRTREDFFLSRYGSYLLAMNGDTAKPEIAAAQTYFAVQTRHSEIRDVDRRLDLRERVKVANKALAGVAIDAGVPSGRFGIFQNEGYRGLYGGLGLKEIKAKKGIPKSDDLLDRAGEPELAANWFRITQAEQKIEREGISGEKAATAAHREIGNEVRDTIKRIGGVMPEQLPAEPSIKKLAKQQAKRIS